MMMLVIFSSRFNGPRSYCERRRKLSKMSLKRLVQVADKLLPQNGQVLRATEPLPSQPVLIERLLSAEFGSSTGFYRWADSSVESKSTLCR